MWFGAKRIYVDMDDTMCDFKTAYKKCKHDTPEIIYPHSQHGFFRGLSVLDKSTWYVKGIADLGHDVWILSKPSYMNRLCYTEKADWIYDHMGGEWVEKLILCSDKALLKGDILIDDVEWMAFEGEQILYDQTGPMNWKRIYGDLKVERERK